MHLYQIFLLQFWTTIRIHPINALAGIKCKSEISCSSVILNFKDLLSIKIKNTLQEFCNFTNSTKNCTYIFQEVFDVGLTADALNHDLAIMHYWAFQWKMIFNPDATKQAKEITRSY